MLCFFTATCKWLHDTFFLIHPASCLSFFSLLCIITITPTLLFLTKGYPHETDARGTEREDCLLDHLLALRLPFNEKGPKLFQ